MRHRFQFGVRSLLLLTMLLSVFMAGFTSDWWCGLSPGTTEFLVLLFAPTLEKPHPRMSLIAAQRHYARLNWTCRFTTRPPTVFLEKLFSQLRD